MTPRWFDPLKPEFAYFLGFAQADGHLSENTRNRGRFSIEISLIDAHIVEYFQSIIQVNSTIYQRTRNTNFKSNSTSVVWNCFDWDFRLCLQECGIPVGKKSHLVTFPVVPVSTIDYVRGLIDGDGSVGITGLGLPFVSFLTASEGMCISYINFLQTITGKLKTANRNKRDNIFNVMITREDAQKVASALYYPGCVCLNRKRETAQQVIDWVRPERARAKPQVPAQKWTAGHDLVVLTNPISRAAVLLDRTKSSVANRRNRLNLARRIEG